ncbi:unnamed protein product, partial [Brassica rapa subsp. narinosa]
LFLQILLIIHLALLSLSSFPLKISWPPNGDSRLCFLCSFSPLPPNVISLFLFMCILLRLTKS